jgi:hypothetical protein
MLFEGLLAYQIWLLMTGFVFFLCLLVLLIIYTIQKRSPGVLLPFFIFPVVMIGFPGIKKVTFGKDTATIETLTLKLEQNPGDSTARQELTRKLPEIEKKSISDPQTLSKIAQAHEVLGDTVKAKTWARKALTKAPNQILAKRILATPHLRPPGH